MTISNKLAASLVAGTLGSVAHATPIVMSDTVTLGNLLNNQSTTIHYDASNLLAAQGLTSGDVLSGSLVIYGLSDISYQTSADPYGAYFVSGSSQRNVSVPYTYYQQVYVQGTPYSCGFWGYSTCYNSYAYYQQMTGYYTMAVTDYTETEQRNIEHRDTVDTMTASVGATSGSTQDSVVGSSTGAYTTPSLQYTSGGGYYSGYSYYSQERDVYNSVSGPLELSLVLDSTALQNLRDTGFIDITVNAGGQFSLQSIGVSMDGAVPDAKGVPEPASVVLSLTGMAAIVATRRRKKKSVQ